MLFAWLKDTCDPKVNQVDMPIFADHHVGRLEIAKDDWRLMSMQVVQNIAELLCPLEDGLYGQRSTTNVFQVFLDGFPFNKIHDQVGTLIFCEAVINTR